MSIYPIEATSIAFNDIKQNLMDFVKSKPDANRWRDFYTGGEGTILIELIAGYGFYNALKVIFSMEETYLHYVNTLLSARAIALNCAYSAYRGTNRRYKLRFKSNTTVSIPAFTVIGYQGDYDFICLEDTVLNEGEICEVYGAVGVFSSLSIEAPSPELHVFRFNDSLVSDDFKLYLNDVEMETTNICSQALEDLYLVQSNAVGGVNVTYLNLNEGFTHKYQTGDILRLDYIRYQNIPYSDDITIDYADEIEVIATENTIVPETIESIQVKAPIMYETQQTIRGREDYVKNFLQLRAKFKDTTGRDLSAAYVELSYVQNDETLMTQKELDETLHTLTYKRFFGVPVPYINHPRCMNIPVKIQLKLNSSNIVLAEYNEIVARIVSSFEHKFSDMMEEVIIDFAELERLMEREQNVKRASITIDYTPFEKSKYYQLGDVIYDNRYPDLIYRVSNIGYRTMAVEPKWNYELGSETQDGSVIWKAVPKSGSQKFWAPKETVGLYDLRLPTEPEMDGIMFRAIRGKSLTQAAEKPEWNPQMGGLTYDGEIIWRTVEYVATAGDWDSNTWFNLGDVIKGEGVSYQVVGERRKSSTIHPEFLQHIEPEEGEPYDINPDTVIYENMMLTKEVLTDERVILPWGVYCVIDYIIDASVQ